MSVDIKLPIGPFLRLSIVEYRASLKGAEVSPKMLEEALTVAHDAWHAARKKKRGAVLTEEQFLAQLKADPELAGVAFDKELTKCQYWCRNQQPPVQATRRRIVNWMNRADRAVGTGQSAAPKADPGPAGWLPWCRENVPEWRRFAEEAADHPVPPWHKLEAAEQFAIRSQMKP